MALTQISTEGIKNGTITGSDLATNIDLVDNQKLRLGNSQDLQIYHDGSNSEIKESIGNLNIICNSSQAINLKHGAENMLRAITDGSVELYFDNIKRFETTGTGVEITGDLKFDSSVSGGTIRLQDGQKLFIGGGNDLQIYHDGTDSFIDNSTGNLKIISPNNVEAIKVFTDGTVNIGNNADNVQLRFGLGSDLKIFHDGTHSFISNDGGAGNLVLYGNGTNSIVGQAVAGENSFIANSNGSVVLYFDNSVKFETTSAGGTITGALTTNNGGGNAVLGSHLDLGDNQKVRCGASDDLQIFHDGTTSLIKSASHAIAHFSNIRHHFLNGDGSAVQAVFVAGGQCELYHNNSKKFETSANGAIVESGTANFEVYSTTDDQEAKITIIGKTASGGVGQAGRVVIAAESTNNNNGASSMHLRTRKTNNTVTTAITIDKDQDVTLPIDNQKLRFGAGVDLKIYSDGTNGILEGGGSGGNAPLFLNANTIRLQTQSGGEKYIDCQENGAVELYHNNVKMLDTSSQGVNFRGEIRSASTDSNLSNCTLKNESTSADGTDYLQCRTNNNTVKMVVAGNGDLRNTNNSYGQESDSKLKENIVDANSQWNDIKAIKVRNFNFKESTGFSTHTQIGVVAQELEITSPHLVYESIDRDPDTSEDLGTKTKNVRYSVMYMKAIKALQEAMSRIETLETEVAALKAG